MNELTEAQSKYYEYLKTSIWKHKRQETIERDGRRCRLCDSAKRLNVHHRKYPKVYGEEPLEDLITLCGHCHDTFHNVNNAPKPVKKNARKFVDYFHLAKCKEAKKKRAAEHREIDRLKKEHLAVMIANG